jgi:type II secretory pathway pseudopilin PulG
MTRKQEFAQKGFSLLEALIVIAVIMVVAGMAVIGYQSNMYSYRADAAADAVATQLRTARQMAISKRRWVEVTFDSSTANSDNAPHVNYQIQAISGETPFPVVSQALPSGTQFLVFPTLPDTPMAFGNGSAVYIGGVTDGPPKMDFGTTGAFVSNENPFGTISGTIFVGISGKPEVARAVTILGGTGRVRTYYYSSSSASSWRE